MSAMDALKAAMAAQGKVDPEEVVEKAKELDLDDLTRQEVEAEKARRALREDDDG